jgi:carbonic anhydrase
VPNFSSAPPSSCDCHSAPLLTNRRRFLTLAAGGAAAALLPRFAWAAGTTDTLLLSCMDYRLVGKVAGYMDHRGLAGDYDHIVLAGASIGVATKSRPDWSRTFWEHLGIAKDLHHVKDVIIIDHRDCGAYKLILGKDLTGEAELDAHRRMLQRTRKLIAGSYPALKTELLFMELDGSVVAV